MPTLFLPESIHIHLEEDISTRNSPQSTKEFSIFIIPLLVPTVITKNDENKNACAYHHICFYSTLFTLIIKRISTSFFHVMKINSTPFLRYPSTRWKSKASRHLNPIPHNSSTPQFYTLHSNGFNDSIPQ